MDTVVRPPGSPPRPPAVSVSRPRWPRRLRVTLLISLVVALIAGLAWMTNVEPLTRGSSGFAIHDPEVRASIRDVDALGAYGLVNTVRVEPGSSFRYDVTIRNDGRSPSRS